MEAEKVITKLDRGATVVIALLEPNHAAAIAIIAILNRLKRSL
jgi:hypothetical protein